MPNWCDNKIVITGPEQKIQALWDRASNDSTVFGLLNAMVEQPDFSQEEEEQNNSFMPIWYNWRLCHWGCKWDIHIDDGLDIQDLGDGRKAIYGFVQTPWAPPLEAFSEYAFDNEDVVAEVAYVELGNSFAGFLRLEDGMVADQSEIDGIPEVAHLPQWFQSVFPEMVEELEDMEVEEDE